MVEDNHQHSLQEQPAEAGRVRNHPAAAVGILAEERNLGSELHTVAVAVEEFGACMQLHSENQHLHKVGELRLDQCIPIHTLCLSKPIDMLLDRLDSRQNYAVFFFAFGALVGMVDQSK